MVKKIKCDEPKSSCVNFDFVIIINDGNDIFNNTVAINILSPKNNSYYINNNISGAIDLLLMIFKMEVKPS